MPYYWILQVEKILDDWRDYKLSVPTYGAIILNEDLSQVNIKHKRSDKCAIHDDWFNTIVVLALKQILSCIRF